MPIHRFGSNRSGADLIKLLYIMLCRRDTTQRSPGLVRLAKKLNRPPKLVASDGDIWIEKEYIARVGTYHSYFVSVNHGTISLFDAPTGAEVVIRASELPIMPDWVKKIAITEMTTAEYERGTWPKDALPLTPETTDNTGKCVWWI